MTTPSFHESAFQIHGPDAQGIAELIFDLPGEKVNKLNGRVMKDFSQAIETLSRLQEKKSIQILIVRSGKAGTFIAGADIEMIRGVTVPADGAVLSREGHEILARFEDLPFKKVAFIEGPCLGGGLEFALACDVMIASDHPATKIGLPEVMLGLLPGMGGCFRLPAKIGLAQSLDFILTGRQIRADRAAKVGLVEACLPKEDFLEQAKRWVGVHREAILAGEKLGRKPSLGGGLPGPLGKTLESVGAGRSFMVSKARSGVMAKTKGLYPAPLLACDVLEKIGRFREERLRGIERDQCIQIESEAFGRLSASPESKALIRLFFMTESIKRQTGVLSDVKISPITQAAVLGAGVMGGGIAQLCAEKDIPILMKDIQPESLDIGIQAAAKLFRKQVKRKRITARQSATYVSRIRPQLDFAQMDLAQIVVEAVVENLEVKKKVLAELETHVSADCVIASNTSSLSISKMQESLKRPELFAGMHFFNPVHKMPLIEVIRGEKTGDHAIATVVQLSKKLGKMPVVVKDSAGFLVNRLLAFYLNEAVVLLAEGNSMSAIDEALLGFGMPMGPLELIDEVGVDVAEKVAHILGDAFPDRLKPSTLNRPLIENKRLGKKTRMGLYRYEGDADRLEKVKDESVMELLGIADRRADVGAQEMVDRCVLLMVNESARCLEERVVQSAEDLDLAMIMGTGFPPFRGGIAHYADHRGIGDVIASLERLRELPDGDRFTPSSALRSIHQLGGFEKAFPKVSG